MIGAFFCSGVKTTSAQAYTLFRGACPSWDNTARKEHKGTVFYNNSPKLFEKWLTNAFVDAQQSHAHPDERIVFINAWNEWAEGAHLEPDRRLWLRLARSVYARRIEMR
jgi:lipopolysaccharide biosynthesis protein